MGGTETVNTRDYFSRGFLCNTAKIALWLGSTKMYKEKALEERMKRESM